MIHPAKTSDHPIDAVITWVDDSAGDHLLQRRAHLKDARNPLHENAVNPHRWACNGEVQFCLQSIASHAPWLRRIWIVVAQNGPDLSGLPAELVAKITCVRHEQIFTGYDNALPTFNSLAIESLIWRIEGLSERFVYFNDDVFLTAPLNPHDVFEGDRPVLRGKWTDYADVLDRAATRADPAHFNDYMQVNAARLIGFAPTRVFRAAHVVHPLKRSVMAQLARQFTDAFATNVGHRFRDLDQFLPQGLHNHACIAADNAIVSTVRDNLHLKSGQGIGRDSSEIRALLAQVERDEIKFLCINDLPQLESLIPDLRAWLDKVVGEPETAQMASRTG